MRSKIILIIILSALIHPVCFAQTPLDEREVIKGFDEGTDLPILNEELRKREKEIDKLQTRVTNIESNTVATVVAATQAEMESATDSSVYASPGRVQYHPGAAKAWCVFDGADTGSHACDAGYNVTSIERVTTGDYTITWDTDFSSGNYVLVGTGSQGSDTVIALVSLSAGSADFDVQNSATGTLTDDSPICIVAYGDQ